MSSSDTARTGSGSTRARPSLSGVTTEVPAGIVASITVDSHAASPVFVTATLYVTF